MKIDLIHTKTLKICQILTHILCCLLQGYQGEKMLLCTSVIHRYNYIEYNTKLVYKVRAQLSI